MALPSGEGILEDLGRKLLAGQKVDLVGGPSSGRTATMRKASDILKSSGRAPVLVRISPTLDKTEHALLSLGQQLGADCAQAVATQLERAPGKVAPVLELIRAHLGPRPLLVDDADDLRPSGSDDLQFIFRAGAMALSDFFSAHATVRTLFDDEDALPGRSRVQPQWQPPSDRLPKDLEFLRRRTAGDATRLPLAVARSLLQYARSGEPSGSEALGSSAWSEAALLEDVWELADRAERELLVLLAAHVRPLETSLLGELGISTQTLERACRSWLVERDDRQVWLSRAWLPWLGRVMDLRPMHERLAQVFERRAELADLGVHIAMLEAFRHYVAADEDVTRARHFLHFGVASLLERAFELSARERKWGAAARLYRTVLDLDRELRKQTPDEPSPIGTKPRSYACHYWHYNRYKAGTESISETDAGYVEALNDWPTNALFWSRLVVARFVADRWEDALASLRSAHDKIPSLPARNRRLIERSTARLLERAEQRQDLVLAALLVWRDHQPDDTLYAIEIHQALLKALASGVSTRFLPHAPRPIVLHVPVRARFIDAQAAWVCQLEELNVTARSGTPIIALERAAAQLRDDCRRLLTTLTHKLSPEDRDRKRLLLGYVDIVASGITSPGPEETWLLAKLRREEGLLQAFSLEGQKLDLAKVTLPDDLDETSDLWVVRVASDPTGAPTSVVVAFEDALTGTRADEIWRRWTERWHQADA